MYEQNGKVHITIAGLSKQNGVKYLETICKDNIDIFNHFNNDLYIPPEHTGRIHTHILILKCPVKLLIIWGTLAKWFPRPQSIFQNVISRCLFLGSTINSCVCLEMGICTQAKRVFDFCSMWYCSTWNIML